jgi:hypothetical protein
VDHMARAVTLRAAGALSLAAAPTFGLMAVFTGVLGNDAHQAWCSAAIHMPALGGMAPMYALMCLFHVRPWLGLISRWLLTPATP